MTRRLKKKRYVLVLSGGGIRGFYTLWILKALEEAGLKDKIDAIYGISVWAILGCYRAAGRTAQEMFEHFYSLEIIPKDLLKLLPTKSILKTTLPQRLFKTDLPQTFEELNIKTYVGATDLYSAELIMFNQGPILEPLLGSMAIPGIFPNVPYQNYLLNDGGVIDNFPSTIAQKQYPDHQTIGVSLDTFERQQHPKNLIDTLITTFEIMMGKELSRKLEQITIPFYEKIDCSVLEFRKSKRKKAFEQGYLSGKKKFSKLNA